MFLQNKYTRWYFSIIKNARDRVGSSEYQEKHHIIPKCLGGKDAKINLVSLTGREHFICHVLLTKMIEGNDKYRLAAGLHRMMYCRPNERKVSSRTFELARSIYAKEQSDRMKMLPRTSEWNANIGNSLRGRKLTSTHCLLISERQKGEKSHFYGKSGVNAGKILSEETKNKISVSLSGDKHPMFGVRGTDHYNTGRKHTAESSRLKAAAMLGKKQSPEHKQKRIDALNAHYARKKANASSNS